MAVGVPTAVALTCPRCKFRRYFVNVDGGTTFRCAGCEWTLTIGPVAVPAAPAVPASTVNATNTSAGVIAVTITGGTLTAVTVNAVQVGTTAGTYLVPPNGTINITYTVAPAWTWQQPVTSGAMAQGVVAVPVASGGTYYTAGMQLLIDTTTTAEVLTVAAGATGTSIPVSTTLKAHGGGVVIGNLLVTPTYNGVAQDQVPALPGWGF